MFPAKKNSIAIANIAMFDYWRVSHEYPSDIQFLITFNPTKSP